MEKIRSDLDLLILLKNHYEFNRLRHWMVIDKMHQDDEIGFNELIIMRLLIDNNGGDHINIDKMIIELEEKKQK